MKVFVLVSPHIPGHFNLWNKCSMMQCMILLVNMFRFYQFSEIFKWMKNHKLQYLYGVCTFENKTFDGNERRS